MTLCVIAFLVIFFTIINDQCEKLKAGLRCREKVDLNFLFILCIYIFSMKKPVFCQKNAFIYKKNPTLIL